MQNIKAKTDILCKGGKSVTFNCKYCFRDITLSIRFCCAECDNMILCENCFLSGVELNKHKKTHNYEVSDCFEGYIFAKEWSINEELLLLEGFCAISAHDALASYTYFAFSGIDKFGMGNWKLIGDYISTKTPKQVEEHYWET